MLPPEVLRQLVHIFAGIFALALRWLTWWQAAAFAALALLLNIVALPRIAPRLLRSADSEAWPGAGVVIYPAAVLALVLCFPHRLDIAAVAWIILAAGDGMATLVGAHLRTAPLPWNRAKSAGGLAAFIVAGAVAAIAVMFWMSTGRTGDATWLVVAPIAATVVAAFVETAPIRLNDNITVPAAAALVLWTMSFVSDAFLQASWNEASVRLLPAVILNAGVATAGWAARTVTMPGAIAGAVIGIAVYLGTGWAGWILLFASFLAAAIATRAGFRLKTRRGIAEQHGGRRGPGNAIANTGLAAWAALLAIGVDRTDLALLAMVAALVTTSSDTVASEIGKIWGRTTWLIVGFRRVPPGTSGAVSLEGTIAGIAAAAVLGLLAVVLGLVPSAWLVWIVVAATVASFIESVLGATLEKNDVLNNDALNFINSAVGAGLALAIVTA